MVMVDRGSTIALVGLLCLGWPLVGAAGESERHNESEDVEVDELADAVELFDGEVRIYRPSGWSAVVPGEGAVAAFRSTTDDEAQIEVRVSDSVTEGRWERYWRAFDTNLRQVGFEIYRPRVRQSYGGRRGLVFEYSLEQVDGEQFRLLVWHTHVDDRAWIFTAFFRQARREAFGHTFSSMLDTIEWDARE